MLSTILVHFSHSCAHLSYYRAQTIYEYKMLAFVDSYM